MKKLTSTETLRHLDLLTAAAPAHIAKPTDAAAFATLLERIRSLIREQNTAELSTQTLRATLFPHASGDSQRVLFSNFRKTLDTTATATCRNFSLFQPNLRGKALDEVICYFRGDAISATPDLDKSTRDSLAGLNRKTLIAAPAAVLTREQLTRITEILWEKSPDGRRPIRIFLSYAHKDDALVEKLLARLRDELAISKSFVFSIWLDTRILSGNEWHQDIQQALTTCDLCVSLVSPAFFASGYITREELPLTVNGTIPGVPVMLEPIDFSRCNLHGLEQRQIESLKENHRHRAFSECTGEVAKRFAAHIAAKIEEKIPTALEHLTHRHLGDPEKFSQLLADHPELEEIFLPQPQNPNVARAARPFSPPTKTKLTTLLKNHLPKNSAQLLEAYCAVGGLREITGKIEKTVIESDDPYARFSAHAQRAVTALQRWVADPTGPPFAAVLGEIGSGKTTTLQMLAAALVADPTAPPVILIDLRDYFDSADPKLENLLAEHLRRHDSEKSLTPADLLRAVREERALIIFDGLDEKIISMSEAARQNFIRELWRVLPADLLDAPASSGRGRLIISCRSHYFPTIQSQSSGYLANDRGHATEKDYLACIMLPWQDEQIREYLSRLLGEEKSAIALDLIETIHNLKDLAQRPYLLNLIGPELEGLENDRHAGRSINAASLYHKFTERWLARDDGKHVFTPTHKRRLMEQLAADLWQENSREWPWERVEEWLDDYLHAHPAMAGGYSESRAVLKQDFRTATLFLRPDGSADSFRFAHTSLQEYFLASHLCRSLHTRDGQPAEAWNLPMPSLETLDFLGQMLQTLPVRDQETSLQRLRELLGNPAAPVLSRGAAMRYWLLASEKSLPVPDRPDLAMSGIDFTAWEFHGSAERPLRFGSVDFSESVLIRATFEYVHFAPASRWCGADMRSVKFIESQLVAADFSAARLDGIFFRKCDLRDSRAEPSPPRSGDLRIAEAHEVPMSGNELHPIHSQWTSADRSSVAGTTCPRHPIGAPCTSADRSPPLLAAQAPANPLTATALLHLCQTTPGGPWPELEQPIHSSITSLIGHANVVTSVAFSPDAKLIVSGSFDNTLKLWDAVSGSCIRSFVGHTGRITSVAFSPETNLILSGSDDCNLKLWDAVSGVCIRSFAGHDNRVNAVAFSPDEKFILSGSDDKSTKLWDLNTGGCILSLAGHDGFVTSVAFSSDSKFILSGSHDKTLKLWDAYSGICIRSFSAPYSSTYSVAIVTDKKLALFDSITQTFNLSKVDSSFCLRSFAGHIDSINTVAFSPNAKLILSGAIGNTLKLWDADSGSLIRSYNGHDGAISSVTFSPDAKLILSGSYDKTLKLWDVDSGSCIQSFAGHGSAISSVAFSPDAKLILSGSFDSNLKIWDVVSGSCIRSFSGYDSEIYPVAIPPDTNQIASQHFDGKVICSRDSSETFLIPKAAESWLRKNSHTTADLTLELIGHASILLRRNDTLLREILPLPDGQTLVREPWDETEARKPYHACRWKLVSGPADAWRYCAAIDLETLAIHPPELAMGEEKL